MNKLLFIEKLFKLTKTYNFFGENVVYVLGLKCGLSTSYQHSSLTGACTCVRCN